MALLAIGLMKFDPGPLLAHKPSSAAETPAANKPQVVETFGKLPLHFIENQGQLDPRVAYYIPGWRQEHLLEGSRWFVRPAKPSLLHPALGTRFQSLLRRMNLPP